MPDNVVLALTIIVLACLWSFTIIVLRLIRRREKDQ